MERKPTSEELKKARQARRTEKRREENHPRLIRLRSEQHSALRGAMSRAEVKTLDAGPEILEQNGQCGMTEWPEALAEEAMKSDVGRQFSRKGFKWLELEGNGQEVEIARLSELLGRSRNGMSWHGVVIAEGMEVMRNGIPAPLCGVSKTSQVYQRSEDEKFESISGPRSRTAEDAFHFPSSTIVTLDKL